MAAPGLGALGDDVVSQRLERGPSPPPGNLECASQGSQSTQFCLLNVACTCSHLDGGILDNDNDSDHLLHFHDISSTASTSRSSRSSTLSTVSTTLTTADCDCKQSTTSGPLCHSQTRSSLPAKRSRRDREQLHAARLQRSRRNGPPSGCEEKNIKLSKAHWSFRQSGNSGTAEALAAFEPANERNLAKMSTLEQQRWINVQEKTFRKWYVDR